MKIDIELIIEKSMRALKSAQREFDAGDYDFSIRVGEEEARNCIDKAKEIFDEISVYLEKKKK